MALSPTVLADITNSVFAQCKEHHGKNHGKYAPFMVALTGLQGSGKSTWAAALTTSFEQRGLRVVNVSLDDFYHDHTNLVRIREENKENALLRTRGQPGTHDQALAADFFASLRKGDGVEVPSFDKSKFQGEGDRAPGHYVSNVPPIDIVIFEGWCVGFQALNEQEVRRKWEQARTQPTWTEATYPTQTLADHALEHLQAVNTSLEKYNATFLGPDNFDFFVHLDTENLENVYRWRLDQEHALRRARGTGMTDEAVVAFVRGYMPSYELYCEQLRKERVAKTHVRVLLGREREVERIEVL